MSTKTAGERPPLIDDDGEVREITFADMENARRWQPGDPVSTLPRNLLQANRVRFRVRMMRVRAREWEQFAEVLGLRGRETS